MPFVNLDDKQKKAEEIKQNEQPQNTNIPAYNPNIPIVGADDFKSDASRIQDQVQDRVQEVQDVPGSDVIVKSRPFNDIVQVAGGVTQPEELENEIKKEETEPSIASSTQAPQIEDMKQTPQSAEITETQEIPMTQPSRPVEPAIPPAPAGYIQKETPPVTATEIHEMPAEEKVTEPSSDILSIEEYAKLSMDRNASDIHFTTNYPVYFRIDGRLEKYSPKILDAAEVESLLYSLLSEDQKKQIENGKELDFMYVDPEENRFRVNIFREKGNLAGAFRSIPKKVKTINELGLPEILKEFSKISYGLVVVTGPTGSGKSTTIAAMIEEINSREPRHIITIEDPVEYVYEQKMALIAQRNMHEDTQSWNDALRAALRQDPDVVLIGEMRDYETISSALTIAETGHLVFATLHTNSAAQTIDRIIDVFPADQQNQVRTQLGNMLSGVISQRLIPLKNGGRKAAMEVLIASNAIKNAIREGKTHQIDNIIQTSLDIGMFPLEKSLVDMIRMNEIDIQTAKNFTIKPDQIDLLLK